MGAFDSGLPSHETYAYRLLELVAVRGEFPTSQVSRLPGSTTYKEAVIRSLKKERLLKPYSRDCLHGYRLGSRAKRLLQENPARFSVYFTGETETNRLKCEPSRRLRLHRLAQTYVTMQNAGVSIFRDEKSSLQAPAAVTSIVLGLLFMMLHIHAFDLLLAAAGGGLAYFMYTHPQKPLRYSNMSQDL